MQGLLRTPFNVQTSGLEHHEGYHSRLTPLDGSGLHRVAFAPVPSAAARRAAVHTRSTTAHAGNTSAGVRQRAALDPSHVVDGALSTLSSRLKLLQCSFSNLNDDPSIDGALNASQQLAVTQRQLQVEIRRCKLELYRARRDARAARAATTSADAAVLTPAGGDWSTTSVEQQAAAELAALNQLRVSADDGQDFLLGLVQQLLQHEPPTSCSRLLVALASRKLNVEALNRLAVDTFVEKQAAATPHDMAGLMAALALVGCCSSNTQVAGFERLQLSSLFSGIMSHLVSHVSVSLQQQQQQQQAATPREDVMAGPERLQLQSACELSAAGSAATATGAGTCPDTVKAVGAPGAEMDTGLDSQTYLQQVAAALAAHVSAKVPIDSSLTPHIMHLLQDQVPKWLHTVAEVEASQSVTHLATLVSHSGRYDFTYLAAALHRLAQLAHQQDSCTLPADGDVSMQRQQQQQRIAKVLVGRCKQMLGAASPGELQMVLTAAAKLGIHDSRFYAAAGTCAVTPVNLASASDAYVAAVMFAVATNCSSSNISGGSSADSDAFSRQQQQDVMTKCLKRLIALARQQQQQQRPSSVRAAGAAAPSRRRRARAAEDIPVAAAGARTGVCVQPANVITALWAAATCGLQAVKQLHAAALFDYLAEPDVVQQLTGRRSWQCIVSKQNTQQQQQQHVLQLEQIARDCGTVIWAAAQLGFSGQLDKLKPYALAFLSALDAESLSCCSIVTVGVSLAMLLSRDKEWQQHQGRHPAERPSLDCAFWESSFLQCSRAVVQHMIQQPPDPAHAASVAAQLLWGFDTLGLRVPQADMQALLDLSGDLAPRVLVQQHWQHVLSAAVTLTDVQQVLQRPAAAASLKDPSMAAAVMVRLIELQQGPQQQQEDGLATWSSDGQAASTKAVLRDCCSRISQQLFPTLHALYSSAADRQQVDPAAASTTAAAAAVMWALPRLQCRDSALASACLKAFAVGMASASAADAAAVVSALSEAGRLVGVVYSADSSILHEVVKTCTDSIVKGMQSSTPQQSDSHTGSSLWDELHSDMHLADSMLQGYCPAVLAQKLLQLHVAVGLQPSAQQTFQLLSASADESWLSNLKPNAAAATVAASLVAVAELSQLPGWQGISMTSGSNGAAASSMRPGQGNTRNSRNIRASQFPLQKQQQQQQQVLQFPWAWQGQHQQVVQELWQQLLLQALLPRLLSSTAKQLSSALLAVAVLAGASDSHGGAGSFRGGNAADGFSLLEIGLAKDFTQAVLDAMLCLRPAAVSAAELSSTALSQHDKVETAGGFLAAWRQGDWKGEHVAAVAVAAALLGVPCLPFFASVEQDLLGDPHQLDPADAACADQQPEHHRTSSMRQQPVPQRHKPRVVKMHLQHVVSICCASAALDCKVERLLSHAVASALQQVQQQKHQHGPPAAATAASQAMPAAAAPNAQAETKHIHKPRGKPSPSELLGPELLLLLANAVAVMDVSALTEQAQELAAFALHNHEHLDPEPAATAAVVSRKPSETPSTTSVRHSGVLTARLVQLHAWLSSSSSSRTPWSLADVLSHSEVLAARAAWASLQQRSNIPVLNSISAAMGHLLRSTGELPRLHDVTEDGAVAADIKVTIHGVPVAVVLLNDAEEPSAANVGGVFATAAATAAAEQLAAGWAPVALRTPAASTGAHQDGSCTRELHAEGAALLTGTCSQRALVLAGQLGLGDAMWRAKALASRGYWVELISSREWMFLEGRWDAQVQYMRERLWPLLSKGGSVDVSGDDHLSPGVLFAVTE